MLWGWKVWGYWCGRNIGSNGSCGRCGRTTGWHSWLSAQTAVLIDVVKIIVMPGEIMMVSTDFIEEPLELIDLLISDFVMVMVFNSVDETLALCSVCSWSRSCKVSETED